MTAREFSILKAIETVGERNGDSYVFNQKQIVDYLNPILDTRPHNAWSVCGQTLRAMLYKFEVAGMSIRRTTGLGRGAVATYRLTCSKNQLEKCIKARAWVDKKKDAA